MGSCRISPFALVLLAHRDTAPVCELGREGGGGVHAGREDGDQIGETDAERGVLEAARVEFSVEA